MDLRGKAIVITGAAQGLEQKVAEVVDGAEVHKLDQFFVEEGTGEAVLDGVRTTIRAGFAVLVPAGTKHNIINTGSAPREILETARLQAIQELASANGSSRAVSTEALRRVVAHTNSLWTKRSAARNISVFRKCCKTNCTRVWANAGAEIYAPGRFGIAPLVASASPSEDVQSSLVVKRVGKVTGDTKLEAEGKNDKVAGKVQQPSRFSIRNWVFSTSVVGVSPTGCNSTASGAAPPAWLDCPSSGFSGQLRI